MMPTTLNPPIALEIVIPESLFRRLQQVLDEQPSETMDDLASKAISAYLAHSSRC